MVSFKMITLSTAAALLSVSAPALADVKTKQVQYNDLDLSGTAGQQRLATRVKSAFKAVCGTAPRSLSEKQDWANCVRDSEVSAMPKVERTIARYQETKRLAANERSAIVGN